MKDKVIIVTGSSGGIGGAIANTLSERGAEVIGLDLPKCDITNNEHLDEVVSNLGKIDGLVNCAGVSRGSDLFNYTAVMANS